MQPTYKEPAAIVMIAVISIISCVLITSMLIGVVHFALYPIPTYPPCANTGGCW